MPSFYMAATIFMIQTLVISVVVFIPVFVVYLHQNLKIDLKEKLESGDRKEMFKITMLDSFGIALLINSYVLAGLNGAAIGAAIVFIAICTIMAMKLMIPVLKKNGFFRRKKIELPH